MRYRRVRERQIERFRGSYEATSEVAVDQRRFQKARLFDFRVPDLESIWQECGSLPKLAEFVDVGQGFSHLGKDQPSFPAGKVTVSGKRFEGAVEGFENLGHGIQTHQLPPIRWLNLSENVIGSPRNGTTRGTPQVLLNEAPVQRAPWCLRAMMDRLGRPAKTPFTILRPLANSTSLEAVWAVLNSPVANAFAYAHSSKWHVLTGTWRSFPVPNFATVGVERIETAVHDYFDAVVRHEAPFPLRGDEARAEEAKALRQLHWRIDAEVLRLYQLPAVLERQLLDYFAGWTRPGVPFKQERYFPEGFDETISLADFLAITADWDVTNKRRLELIEKKAQTTLASGERAELQGLQRLAGLKRELLSSPSLRELAEIEADLKRRALWRGT